MRIPPLVTRTALLALLLSLLPTGAATADHVTTRGTQTACSGAPEDGFTDTGANGSAQESAVDCIAWYEITTGTSATTYEPATHIRRAQMARMVAESMRQSLTRFPEPGDGVDHFPDDNSSPFEADIDFVAEYDIVQGQAGKYNPAGFVTRAQMATFLVNQLEAIGVDVPSTSTDFFDDDNESFHEGNINRLAAMGIASGRQHRAFEPGGRVTRGQMALFISRDLAELVEQGLMVKPDERVDVAEDGAHTDVAVSTVNRAADSFVGTGDDEGHDAERFWYDANDTFLDPDGTEITLGEFEGLLTGPVGDTPADVVDVTYAHAPSAESTFEVVTDNVPPPSGATAEAGDHDGDGDRSDVIVDWTASQQPNVLYDVFRADGGLLTDDTEVASDQTGTSVLLTDEPDGTWSYYVRAESPPTGSTSTTTETNEVTVPATGDSSGAPTSEAAVQVAAEGQPARADTSDDGDGDVWRFAFSEPLGEIEDGDSLTLLEGSDATQDAGEDRVSVKHDEPATAFPAIAVRGDATFTLNESSTSVNGKTYGPGQVLTVELLAQPQHQSGGTGDVLYPLTVLYSTGLTDEGGQPVSWPNSADRTVETDDVLPAIVSASGDLNGTGPDRITVTYTEDVTCSATTAPGDDDPEDQFSYDRDTSTSGDEVQATGVDCDGDNTIVVTFPDGVFEPGAPRDRILYTQSDDTAVRIKDNVGNDAESPDGSNVSG